MSDRPSGSADERPHPVVERLAREREGRYCLVSSWGMDYHHYEDDAEALERSRITSAHGILEETIGLWTEVRRRVVK